MKLGDRTTDELEYLTETLCDADHRVDIVRSVLESALSIYQWHYQTASGKVYRDVKDASAKAIDKVIILLKNAGQNSLADDVADALYNDSDTSVLTKSKVISQVKVHMKILLLERKMSLSNYENNFAEQMKKTFIEWCDTYPLDEAPAHFDQDFEPPNY